MKKFGLKSISLAILLISVLALSCSATETNNKSKLAINDCSVSDNDVNVFLNSVYEFEFSDNIADKSVAKTNSSCFHLTDSEKNAVEISVIFPDDKINEEYKNMVFIRPTSPLKSNTQYTLTIDAGLKTKYNCELNNSQQIAFTTGKDSTNEGNQNLSALGDNIITYTSKAPVSSNNANKIENTENAKEKSSKKTKSLTQAKQANNATESISGDSNNTAIIIVIVVLVVLAFLYFLFTKNKKGEVINTPKEQKAEDLMSDKKDNNDNNSNNKDK